ncbi:MAG: acetyl-CoA carboxylase biotin carboxylase subunit [Phycisphaerae bacterium]
MISRVLIANRGEIALRIIRACRELGIETVAVFSEADRDAAYLRLADKTVCIGPAMARESYLKADRIIAAAEVANVDAIHPGYGFLAESATFAEQCRASKIEFIGPSAESIRMLGDKAAAKKLARKLRVPTVPGSGDVIEEDEEALRLAGEMGYPVMIKAAAGGGGRGMRIAHNEANLRGQLKNARAEAMAAFKDGRVYLEKLIENPRHVEVQILGDRHGNVIHLFERDCTIQRRHQKLIEEAPSPMLSGRTREEICKAAVKLTRSAGYFSAGTVEFLVDRKENYYFIEVNTRIQVEHPVTELVTGVDLVAWQIQIAANQKLTLRQSDIRTHGCAIEARINAEDPSADFRPSPGRIERFRPPGGLGVRWDSHAHAGYVVPPNYDSMIGKLIVHKPTRAAAIACMKRCLLEFELGPIPTTIPMHQAIFDHESFAKGAVDTTFLERTWSKFQQPPRNDA